MAFNYSEHIGRSFFGSGNLRRKNLKESFTERLAAAFREEDRLRSWKYGLVLANFVLLVVAVGQFAVAHSLRASYQHYAPFLEVYTESPYFLLLGVLVLVCACVALGCAGICFNSYLTVVVYGLVLFTIMNIKFCLLLYSIYKKAAASSAVERSFKKGLEVYSSIEGISNGVNIVQRELLCCGADDFDEWFDTETNALPYSCCSLRPSNGTGNCLTTDILYVQTEPCLPKLQEIPSFGIMFIYITTGCMIVTEAVTLLVTCKVGKLIREHNTIRTTSWRMKTEDQYPS